MVALEAAMIMIEENRKDEIKANNMLLIKPDIAQIFQFMDKGSIRDYKKQFKVKDYDWVFYPINKTIPGNLDGGLHWSFMIYSKKEHAFLHFDSIKGMNKMYAKNMVVNMGDGEDYNERGQWPSFYEADCSKQNNSWACGAYLMDFIDRAIQAIGKGKGREIRTMHAKIDEILKTRNKLRQILEENMKEELVGNGEMNDKNNFKGFKLGETNKENNDEISKMIKEVRRESEENKTNIIEVEEEVIGLGLVPKTNVEYEKNDQDKREIVVRDEDKKNNNQMNKENKVCHFWTTKKCKFGQNCSYEHPTRCNKHIEWGICNNRDCKLVHPKMCRNMLNDSYCSRPNCWFNHPTKIKNRYIFSNENHGREYNQNQRGPKGYVNQNIQGNKNSGHPTAWQNNHIDRYQYLNNAPFLAGPTPYEAYKDPNRDMYMIRKIGQMFHEMSSQIMNMNR